jgi:hypothetical protein
VSTDKKGENATGGVLLDNAMHGGGIAGLDNAGQKVSKTLKESANGTYVRNVMDLFFSCFGG